MDRRFPSPSRHFATRSPRDSISIKASSTRVTTGPTSGRTSPRCSSRLPHQETNPHSSRMEHHSANLPTPRPSLLRRSRTTFPRTAHLGSRYRPKTGSSQCTPGKNLFTHGPRTGRTEKIRHRTHPKGLHPSIQEPLCRPLLFHQKERWETPTRSGLPTVEPVDSSEYVSPPVNPSTHQQSSCPSSVHQIRHTMGVQQRPYPKRRRVEGGLHHQRRTIRTNGHVLWS